MDDYVYALHDFVPENDDEVPFKAGERIQVMERDDLYGDGWWQGKNLAGKIGLFPKSYTQPAPAEPAPKSAPASSAHDASPSPQPASSTPPSGALHPLKEEPEPPQSNGATTPSGSVARGEVMQATMTDVQQAIEQLGTNHDMDGARSFTFSSTHGDSTDHDTDHDTEGESDADGEWYKTTRQKLAERARLQVEEARREQEAAEHRVSLPPIDVELSDESDDEEQDHNDEVNTQRLRRHPHIPEEDENEGAFAHIASMSNKNDLSPSITPSENYIVPSPTKQEPDVPTATQATFPHIEERQPPRPASASPASATSASSHKRSFSLGGSRPSSTAPFEHPPPTPSVTTVHAPVPQVAAALPSPAPSHFHQSLASTSSSTKFAASSPLSQSQTFQDSLLSPTSFSTRKPGSHPSDWSVEEVVDWLKSKGFDDGVCDKFIEQEITGDVLLELDINVLKSEIGIIAFGKRMRIANAITDLRRPPSDVSSEHNQPLRSHSQSQSVSQSFTGSTSTRQSLNSPFGLPPISPSANSAGLNMFSPESPPHTGDIAGTPAGQSRRDSDPGGRPAISVSDSQDTVGLGLGIPDAPMSGRSPGDGIPGSLMPGNKASKGRPSQLTLSPSDSALSASVKAISGETPEIVDEQREVMSESETAQTVEARSKRKRVFRQGSSSSKDNRDKDKDKDKDSGSRNSRDGPPDSASPNETGRNPRKRSAEASNRSPQERHSLFGAAFSGTLGKSRKPPPRYSIADVDAPEKSTLSLSRLVAGGGRKSSGRPSTSDGSPSSGALLRTKEKEEKEREKKEKKERRDSKDSAEKEKKDPAVLRKRTTSTADAPARMHAAAHNPNNLKAGQSILQQIGAPDFNGWMRKKGDRYNAWKNRYFLLKGPHLYWLRSNSSSETRIKGYVNIVGYHIVTDEKIDPGRYGFKLVHDSDKTHMFSSDEQSVIREWMKALMKATIDRDYTKPVISSVNIPTIPLTVAQAMNPAPRPPSPSARAATQKALRRENTNQLSTRDAQILMGGVPSESYGQAKEERTRLESVFTNDTNDTSSSDLTAKLGPSPPTRPSRELRRAMSTQTQTSDRTTVDPSLIEWANSHLPSALQITDTSGVICGGLALLRLAESIKGSPCSPPIPDVAFPSGPEDDKLEGLFRLFDFLLDNDVRMGAVSINDIKLGKRDKTVQLLKALRTWEEKRRAITQSIGKSGMHAGPFIAPVAWNQ